MSGINDLKYLNDKTRLMPFFYKEGKTQILLEKKVMLLKRQTLLTNQLNYIERNSKRFLLCIFALRIKKFNKLNNVSFVPCFK